MEKLQLHRCGQTEYVPDRVRARQVGDTLTARFDNFNAKVVNLQAPVTNGATSNVAFAVSNSDLINGLVPVVVGYIVQRANRNEAARP